MNPASAAQTTQPAVQQANGAPVALQPFVRAASEHVEPLGIDVSTVIGNQTLLGLFDVNAFGFLRSIVLYVTATGGTGTAAVYQEDAPWSVLDEVTLQDVNGSPIVGPITGYELFLIHKWGGSAIAGNPDPTRVPSYVAPTTAGNFAFNLRIPVEIGSRDGLGCLPNQNASATYKLRLTQAAKIAVFSTDATGLPTIRVRAWGEYWSQPSPTDLLGQPNAMMPPAVGTTSYWTKQVFTINSGQSTVRLQRVGNFIRNLVLILRTPTTRSSVNMPDPIQLFMDSKLLVNQGRQLQPQYMAERSLTSVIETGVTVFDRTHDWDGLIGGEMRDQWLPTTQATRLEFQGSFGAGGTLVVLTNDIAPKGNPFIG